MSKINIDNQNIEICDICGIKRVDGVFYFSFNNTPVVPNKVFSRVCLHIQDDEERRDKCINTKGELREEYIFSPMDKAMEYTMRKFLES